MGAQLKNAISSYFQTTDKYNELDEATLFLIPNSKYMSDDSIDEGAAELPDDMLVSACTDTPLVLIADKELQAYFRVKEILQAKEVSTSESVDSVTTGETAPE